MSLQLVTKPAIEPVSLLEAKEHLRLDTGSIDSALEAVQSIAPGSHAIAASYSLVGTGVDVQNFQVLVILNAGACGATGTVDVKLQESDDDVQYSDVSPGGAFSQVSETNDNAVYEKAYTGVKKYLRAVATVTNAACEFAVTIVKQAPTGLEDSLISGLIVSAREWAEGYQGRAYITQVWNLVLDEFPETPFNVPLPPLQSVESIKYYDSSEVEYIFASSNYQVDTVSTFGRVGLAYGKTWPQTVTLRPMNGVIVQFKAGYGDTAAAVPERVGLAIKVLLAHWYENREATDLKEHKEVGLAVRALLGLDRVGL